MIKIPSWSSVDFDDFCSSMSLQTSYLIEDETNPVIGGLMFGICRFLEEVNTLCCPIPALVLPKQLAENFEISKFSEIIEK